MCSIGGFISDKPLPAYTCQRLAGALLFFGEDRGRQSSGVFINNRLSKKAEAATTFIYDTSFSSVFEEPATECLIHNRQPTCGGQGDEQAHPFWVGATIGVHNGWLTNCKDLKEKWGIEKPSGVDSELLTAAMDKLGPIAFSRFMNDVAGNAAVALLHKGELFIGRDGNPLEYLNMDILMKEGKVSVTVFGSTEQQVLRAFNHCWLINSSKRTVTLPQQKLFQLNTAGVLHEIGAFKTKSYTRSSFSYEDTDTEFHHSYGPTQAHHTSRSPWRPRITAGMDEGVFIVKIGLEAFTLAELLAIKDDPSIVPIGTDGLHIGQLRESPSGFPHYRWRYEIQQRIKFGDLKDVVDAAVKSADYDLKQAARAARKLEKKSKKKKHRDRNGTLALD